MEHAEPTLRILLATYNGEAYLRSLLDSLLAQECAGDYAIIASDDGSTDTTPGILDEYAARYPGIVVRYRAPQRFGSSQAHFCHLMAKFADTPYLMFCDQDDIWHPDKIRCTRTVMETLPQDLPALVHTDLRVVAQDLTELSPSFLRYSGLNGNRVALHELLVQNVVTGCTMMINRSLARLAAAALPVPEMLMHDWWLALLAAACGNIRFLDAATIDYRQHGSNVVGAKNARSPAYLLHRLAQRDAHDAFLKTTRQAGALLRAHAADMPEDARTLCARFAALPQQSKAARLRTYRRCGFYKSGLPRRIGQILFW